MPFKFIGWTFCDFLIKRNAIDKEIDLINSSSSSDGQYKNKIQRLKSLRNNINTDDDAKNYLEKNGRIFLITSSLSKDVNFKKLGLG